MFQPFPPTLWTISLAETWSEYPQLIPSQTLLITWFRPVCLFIHQLVRSISGGLLPSPIRSPPHLYSTPRSACLVRPVHVRRIYHRECETTCRVPRGSVRIVRSHTACGVLCLPSSGLWCFSQGWQRFFFYQLSSFTMWPHGDCSRPCVSNSFPGATDSCGVLCCACPMPSSSCRMPCGIPLPNHVLHCCQVLKLTARYLWCVCLMHSGLPLADDWLWLSNPAQTYCNTTIMYTDYLQWSYCSCALCFWMRLDTLTRLKQWHV